VKEGDSIEIDVPNRKIELKVSEEELMSRKEKWKKPEQTMKGGYQSLYQKHVLQADQGCDLDFLVGARGSEVPRESH